MSGQWIKLFSPWQPDLSTYILRWSVLILASPAVHLIGLVHQIHLMRNQPVPNP